MSVLVYVKDNLDQAMIIGAWSTILEACGHAQTILESGAFDEVIISNKEQGKSSATTLPTPHE